MFNAIANALLKLAVPVNKETVEAVPADLKAWIDGSTGDGWRESKGAKCQVLHFCDK